MASTGNQTLTAMSAQIKTTRASAAWMKLNGTLAPEQELTSDINSFSSAYSGSNFNVPKTKSPHIRKKKPQRQVLLASCL